MKINVNCFLKRERLFHLAKHWFDSVCVGSDFRVIWLGDRVPHDSRPLIETMATILIATVSSKMSNAVSLSPWQLPSMPFGSYAQACIEFQEYFRRAFQLWTVIITGVVKTLFNRLYSILSLHSSWNQSETVDLYLYNLYMMKCLTHWWSDLRPIGKRMNIKVKQARKKYWVQLQCQSHCC